MALFGDCTAVGEAMVVTLVLALALQLRTLFCQRFLHVRNISGLRFDIHVLLDAAGLSSDLWDRPRRLLYTLPDSLKVLHIFPGI